MTRLLLVHSEPSAADAARPLLRNAGFDVAVVATGAQALHQLTHDRGALVVLDLRLPDMPGVELCRELRARGAAGIIVVGADHRADELVLALEYGADDCITKPYSPRELVARVRSVLRRRARPGPDGHPVVLTAGPVRLDAGTRTASMAGRPLDLPRTEFELLEALLRRAGRTVTSGQLLDIVWDGDLAIDSNTLHVHVERLRAELEPNPAAPRHVVTVRGIGYQYVA